MKKNASILSTLSKVTSEVESFIQNNKMSDVKQTVADLIQTAKKDINELMDKDLKMVKKKIQDETKNVEKLAETIFNKEIGKIKAFVKEHKTELNSLQSTIDNIIGKQTAKKVTKTATKVVAKKSDSN